MTRCRRLQKWAVALWTETKRCHTEQIPASMKANMAGARQNHALTPRRLVLWRSGYREAAVARDLPSRAHMILFVTV